MAMMITCRAKRISFTEPIGMTTIGQICRDSAAATIIRRHGALPLIT